MKKRILLAAILVACVSSPLANHASAQSHPGRLLASNCFQCHGTNGRAVDGIDSLAGKSARDIYHELVEMSSKPANTNIMHVQARGYTDAQMRLIADYLSQLPRR
jgi:cytochrome c553